MAGDSRVVRAAPLRAKGAGDLGPVREAEHDRRAEPVPDGPTVQRPLRAPAGARPQRAFSRDRRLDADDTLVRS